MGDEIELGGCPKIVEIVGSDDPGVVISVSEESVAIAYVLFEGVPPALSE